MAELPHFILKGVIDIEPSYVPKDLADYEEKIMFGLSLRQLAYGIVAIGLGTGFYCLSYLILHIPQDICLLFTVAIAFCFFALGWAKWQGSRPFSDYLKALFKFRKMNQVVIYSNEMYYFERKENYKKDVWKKTKSDARINKRECTEHPKHK